MRPLVRPLLCRLVLVLVLAGVCSALPPSELVLDVRPEVSAPVPTRPYTAAVVEFAWPDGFPEEDLINEPDGPWRRNMDLVRRHVGSAAEQGADLLVLPEYAIVKLFPREVLVRCAAQLPSVDDLTAPCDDPTQHEVISELSCLARTHQMYIVANYIEKEPCSADYDEPACPEDGLSLFNTDLVFNRDGLLIQTYRKHNLFGPELETLQRPAPRLAAFSTDFGVTIGLMTCFDILFEVPAVEMVRRGVTHFAFPTDWSDELPSLTALQMHSAWPRGLGVTLLSAGLHHLSRASIGSGIFTDSGALGYLYDYSSGGAEGGLVTATVPVTPTGRDEATGSCPSDPAPTPRDRPGPDPATDNTGDQPGPAPATGNTDDYYQTLIYDVSEFVSVPLTPGESVKLCDGDFCCELTFSGERPEDRPATEAPADSDSDSRSASASAYRLVVFDGRRNFAPHWSSRICAVVLCADGSQASCSTFPVGAPPPPLPPFSLRGSFGAGWAVFPSVIRTHMQLASEWSYDRTTTEEMEVLSTDRLLVAQLYGRNYALDELEYEPRMPVTDTSVTSTARRVPSCVAAPMS